ncbi:MAG: PepSY domain-containing protein [Brevundimonas sp.]
MMRFSAIGLAALIAAAPLSTAVAQDRGLRGDRQQDERPQRDERPRVSMGEAVQRASSGRPGRFLGASDRGGTIVVRWEYPGGRIADIMVDGRTGRVIGER